MTRPALRPEALGSLTPTQSAELVGLVAEAGLDQVVRALGYLAERESRRRALNGDRIGQSAFDYVAKDLLCLAEDVP